MKYDDVVMVVWDGHAYDRAVGRVGPPSRSVPADHVPVMIRDVGLRDVPIDRLRRFGIEGPGDAPAVGDLVELLAAFPALGVAKWQIARVLELGTLPEAAARAHGVDVGVPGLRVETAGTGGRVRGWVLPDQVQAAGDGHGRNRIGK